VRVQRSLPVDSATVLLGITAGGGAAGRFVIAFPIQPGEMTGTHRLLRTGFCRIALKHYPMMEPPNACALREFLIWMVLQCYWE